MKIFIVSSFYKPGYKAGGPIQSIYNFSKLMGASFQIYVMTRSNDFGLQMKYGVRENEWISLDNHKVMYINDADFKLGIILQQIQKLNPEFIYFNSLFNSITWKMMIYNFFNKIENKIVIAPRGELDPGALSLKRNKKSLFLKIITLFNRKNLFFHATTEGELINIEKYFPNTVKVAANVPNPISVQPVRAAKHSNITNLAFISRISPKKNLLYCIDILHNLNVEGTIHFDIIGPKEDAEYYHQVEDAVKKLQDNIKVNYIGEVENSLLQEKTKKYHFLFFPTLGENYGHIIYECLSFGIPVVISDQTPWKENNNGIFVRNLNDKKGFETLLKLLHTLENKKYLEISSLAFHYAKDMVDIKGLQNSYKELFK